MKLGFIGSGNMGRAMMAGILAKGLYNRETLIASDVSEAARTAINKELGIMTTEDNKKVVQWADIVVMAVKPQYMEEAIADIRDAVDMSKIIVTLAPGKTLSWLKEKFGKELKIVRTMPNTPAMVGEGMAALCRNENVTDEELKQVKAIFDSVGKAEVVNETMMDAVVGVSGSSPAFVYMFIEAMADAAVAEGMPRSQAYKFAAQAVYGSAKMVLETGRHPGELKDMVCSPAGTTIEGVAVLEQKGFRSTVIEAVRKAAERSRRM